MSGSSQKEAVAYGRPLVLSRGGPAMRKEVTAEAQRNAQKELERERLILQQDKEAALLTSQGLRPGLRA